eukprot:836987-Pelagomonas_calceolata.AAC.3
MSTIIVLCSKLRAYSSMTSAMLACHTFWRLLTVQDLYKFFAVPLPNPPAAMSDIELGGSMEQAHGKYVPCCVFESTA